VPQHLRPQCLHAPPASARPACPLQPCMPSTAPRAARFSPMHVPASIFLPG
jgi:hypothetical protein